jgi:hypothetical protein
MKHILISRLVATWVGIVCLVLVFSPHTKQSRFYSIGPNEHLVVLGGIRVNTIGRYLFIVLYSMINTCIRCAKVNILTPWVTLNVQDESKPLGNLNPLHAYEITLVANLYSWVDWWISVNLLMSQVDLIVIEVVFDFVSLYYITRKYLGRV